MSTSAHLTSFSRTCCALGDFRSSAMPRLLRLARGQGEASAATGCGGRWFAIRHRSPLGGSTLMTSAPKSDKITAALGPAMKLAKSTTFSPEKMLLLAMAVLSKSLCAAATSPTAKLRRTFLEEGGGAFLLAFGGGANAEVGRFKRKPLGLAGVHPLVGRFQRELYGDRRVGGDLLQDRLGASDEIGRGDNFVDEADAIGLRGRDRFAGEDQLQRTALADQARQALRAATAWQQPEFHLGLPELGMFGGDPDGASHRRLAAAAERKAIDRRDHRLAEIFDEVQHTLPEPAGLLRIVCVDMREFTDVGAGDEGLVARAGEDHAVHRRVGLCILEGGPQIGPGRRIERVEHLGAIDRHVGDRTLFLVLDVRKR